MVLTVTWAASESPGGLVKTQIAGSKLNVSMNNRELTLKCRFSLGRCQLSFWPAPPDADTASLQATVSAKVPSQRLWRMCSYPHTSESPASLLKFMQMGTLQWQEGELGMTGTTPWGEWTAQGSMAGRPVSPQLCLPSRAIQGPELSSDSLEFAPKVLKTKNCRNPLKRKNERGSNSTWLGNNTVFTLDTSSDF